MSTASPLTMSDITRIAMLHLCRDPQTLASVLLVVAEDDDTKSCWELVDFCDREGIDIKPAIEIVMQPDRIEKSLRGDMIVSVDGGSAIRAPFQFKE